MQRKRRRAAATEGSTGVSLERRSEPRAPEARSIGSVVGSRKGEYLTAQVLGAVDFLGGEECCQGRPVAYTGRVCAGIVQDCVQLLWGVLRESGERVNAV